MKIILFVEIYDSGGIDTFLATLINSWPWQQDEFTIMANANYPGLRNVERRLMRRCAVVRHSRPTYVPVQSESVVSRTIRRIASPLLSYLLLLRSIMSLRRVFAKQEADVLMVVNGGYPGGDSCRAASIAWSLAGRWPKAIHNFHNLAQRAPWHLRFQESLVDLALSRATSRFVTVSHAAADSMKVRPIIEACHSIDVVPNGIAKEEMAAAVTSDLRYELGIPSNTPVCLLLATYEARKGHEFLFRAFREVLEQVPDAQLVACGFGFPHEVERVKMVRDQMGLQRCVHLLGFRTDVSSLLANTDVLVVSSQANESFGYASIEAMAHRVPVVATDVGGIPEVVTNGDGGFCVNQYDVRLFARRIVELLLNDDLRKRQGDLGYLRYQRLFSGSVMSKEYAALVRNVVANHEH